MNSRSSVVLMTREAIKEAEPQRSAAPVPGDILTFQELGLVYHVSIDAIRGWVRHGHLTEDEGLFYVAGSPRVYHSLFKKHFLNVKGRRHPRKKEVAPAKTR